MSGENFQILETKQVPVIYLLKVHYSFLFTIIFLGNLYSLHSSTCFRVIHVPIDSVSAEYYEVVYEGSRSKVSVWVSFFVGFAD